jgi:hypothetical protein
MLDGSLGDVVIAGTWNFNRSRQDVSYYDKGTSSAGVYAVICRNGVIDSEAMMFKPYSEFLTTKNSLFLTQTRVVPLQSSDDNSVNFAVLAENYERKYSTATEMYYDAYGRMVPYTRTIYEGISFANVFCGSFSADCTRTDSAKSLKSGLRDSVHNDLQTDLPYTQNGQNRQYRLKADGLYVFDVSGNNIYSAPFAYSAFAHDSFGNILYAFPSEGRVYYRALPADRKIQDTAHTVYLQDVLGGKLTPLYDGDRVQKNWNNRIITWYDGCFLAYGYQQILNHKAPRSTRNVFYLNKLIMGWR